ncbi:hypothetical protein KBC04_03305 [Candidatus Babeliales bacterium]|nr:hypothetical protein [Candidatus Babeliales bacterium]MBP9843921.1 hypothetical protein [Candidatus Babeliales bacterium]
MFLDIDQQNKLFADLLYLNMSELKKLCLYFAIPAQGEKIQLIEKIQLFLSTGKVAVVQEIPAISKARPNFFYPLAPETLMLKGSFKNDLKTRMFLKSLIGNHFHYTAYGIDWIKDLWMQGTPPTYRQFAVYWQSEYEARQVTKAAMKPEWAYLNFLDRYKKQYPTALKSQAIIAWKAERKKHVDEVVKMLNLNKI